MHNIVTNTNITQGNVKITLNKNGKRLKTIVKHNAGTQALCKYIRNIMTGDCNVNDRPGTIIPCVADSTSEDGLKEMFSAGILATALDLKESADSDDPWASFGLYCIIPSTVISNDIAGFRLYSVSEVDRKNKKYAYLKLNEPISRSEGASLEIEWTLKVSPFTK